MTTDDCAGYVDEPGELTFGYGDGFLLGGGYVVVVEGGDGVLVRSHYLVHLGEDESRGGRVLEPADDGEALELVAEGTLVVERVVDAFLDDHGYRGEHGLNVTLNNPTHALLQLRRVPRRSSVRPHVRYGRDETTPESEEVVDGVGGELPVLAGLYCEIGAEVEPLEVPERAVRAVYRDINTRG